MAKLFTLDEASALLPRLREILGELRRAVAELDAIESDVKELERRLRQNGHSAPDETYNRLRASRERVAGLIGQVTALGCELKDPRSGLIDFPSRREGQIVFLCWKLDEAEVAFWHPTDSGFAGRQPL